MDTDIDTLEALKILFNEDEYAAFGQTVREVASIYNNRLSVKYKPVYYSLNPLKPNSRKCDENIVTCRNILMEIDSLPLGEQTSKMDSLGMPYSIIVCSGGKSKHFVLSVEEDLPLEVWEHYVSWIHAALPFIDHVPKAESVWTRYPNSIRPETGKIQELEFLGFRWPLSSVSLALGKLVTEPPILKPMVTPLIIPQCKGRLRLNTLGCIDGNYVETRNISLFKAACDMFQHGYCEDEIFERLLRNFPFDKTFDEKEFKRTIKSAIMHIHKQSAPPPLSINSNVNEP